MRARASYVERNAHPDSDPWTCGVSSTSKNWIFFVGVAPDRHTDLFIFSVSFWSPAPHRPLKHAEERSTRICDSYKEASVLIRPEKRRRDGRRGRSQGQKPRRVPTAVTHSLPCSLPCCRFVVWRMSKSQFQTRSCCYDQLIEEWDGPNLACRTVALPESPLESPRSSKWEMKRLKF